jgi:hypothetical protein
MTLGIEIAAVVIAGLSAVVFALALGRTARHHDKIVANSPEVAEIAADLEQLSAVRSPAGRRFFPTPYARRELAEMVYELTA